MTTVSTLTGDGDRTPTSEPKPEPIRREVYITLRLKELSETIHDHAVERERLNAILKDRSAEKGGEVKSLRNRRGYLAVRLALLREEQRTLAVEKEAILSAEMREGAA